MRTIQQIDRDIDANRRALMARLHFNPDISARAWQNAWDRCPDLHQREQSLFLERGEAQQERDRLTNKEWARQQRRRRSQSFKCSAEQFIHRHDELSGNAAAHTPC